MIMVIYVTDYRHKTISRTNLAGRIKLLRDRDQEKN